MDLIAVSGLERTFSSGEGGIKIKTNQSKHKIKGTNRGKQGKARVKEKEFELDHKPVSSKVPKVPPPKVHFEMGYKEREGGGIPPCMLGQQVPAGPKGSHVEEGPYPGSRSPHRSPV